MMNDLHTPQILLFSEQEEPQSYEIYVYGTDDLVEQHKDSFCLALCRYLDEIHISQKTLARLTGIAPSTLSRYLSGKRKMQYDCLCAVCIALRLHPCRQRYLFSLLMYAANPDPASIPISEEEEQEQIRHRNRHDYLPDALELLKSDFPEGYELIRDYFLREDKVTMWYLVEKYGLSIDVVRYRIKIAKQKLKEYIILHENE